MGEKMVEEAYRNEIGSQGLNFDKDLMSWLLMRSIANTIMKTFNREYLSIFVSDEEKGKIELTIRYADNDIYNYFEQKIADLLNKLIVGLEILEEHDIINKVNIYFSKKDNKNNTDVIMITMRK